MSGVFKDIFGDEHGSLDIYGNEDDPPNPFGQAVRPPNYPLNPPIMKPNYPLGPPPPHYEGEELRQLRQQLEANRRRLAREQMRAEQAEQRARQAEAEQELRQRSTSMGPYAVLGVTENAPDFIVKAAYRAAAKRVHADAGGSDAQMKLYNQAYEEIAKKRGWTR